MVAVVAIAGGSLMPGLTTAFAQEAPRSAEASSLAEGGWAYVTGAEDSCSDTGWETRTIGSLYRGRMEFTCTMRLSDPRVSGLATGEYEFACGGPDECLYWGSYHIDGPGGTWDGGWSGIGEPTGGASFNVLTLGTGDYAGWTFMAVLRDPFDGTPAQVHGLVFEGGPPPWEPTLP